MLKFNDTEIKEVIYNGVNLDKVYFNGVLVFSKNQGENIYLTHFQLPTDATYLDILDRGE